MILETLTWLSTPCPLWARRDGLLSESIAISARHRRHRAAWQSHLENTRRLICQHAPGGKRVVVLGAGPLLDVPLKSLSHTFDEVFLVDAVHPLTARWQCRQYKNVRRLTHDLRQGLPEEAETADSVISLNLLSQLPDPAAHLEALPAGSLIATDITVEWQGKSQKDVERQLLLTQPLPAVHILEEWRWLIAPAPESHPLLDEFRHVIFGLKQQVNP